MPVISVDLRDKSEQLFPFRALNALYDCRIVQATNKQGELLNQTGNLKPQGLQSYSAAQAPNPLNTPQLSSTVGTLGTI